MKHIFDKGGQINNGKYFDELRIFIGEGDVEIKSRIRDLFLMNGGKVDKEEMDKTITTLTSILPLYQKAWADFKTAWEVKDNKKSYTCEKLKL